MKYKNNFHFSVDIWSVAVLLCDLLTGQNIFGGNDAKNSLREQLKLLGRIDDNILNNTVNLFTQIYKSRKISLYFRSHHILDRTWRATITSERLLVTKKNRKINNFTGHHASPARENATGTRGRGC